MWRLAVIAVLVAAGAAPDSTLTDSTFVAAMHDGDVAFEAFDNITAWDNYSRCVAIDAIFSTSGAPSGVSRKPSPLRSV